MLGLEYLNEADGGGTHIPVGNFPIFWRLLEFLNQFRY